MIDKIKKSIDKFALNLDNKTVLTEAASGNYVVTPIIAALAGANVLAITKNSQYASIKEVIKETYALARKFNIDSHITIITDKTQIDYQAIDIVTNTGFVRPINKSMIDQLSNECVIPLMWEPWEFRESELDLDYCVLKGIKVYGTNENDERLQTMKYIGLTVLYFLLHNKMTSFSTKVLILGNENFTFPIEQVLQRNGYACRTIMNYDTKINLKEYQALVVAEHKVDNLIIGETKDAYIKGSNLLESQYIIHICGNVHLEKIKCKVNTQNPAKFGYMSYTTDFIDNQAVIDLHTAGLKVAEGMIKANNMGLNNKEYKNFMEKFYPAKAFENEKYW